MPGGLRKKREYSCTAHFTQGCSQRMTEALEETYYNREKGIGGTKECCRVEDALQEVEEALF